RDSCRILIAVMSHAAVTARGNPYCWMLGVVVPFCLGLCAAGLAVTVGPNHTAAVGAGAGNDNSLLVVGVGSDRARELDGGCHLLRLICRGSRGPEGDSASLAERLLRCHFSATVWTAKTPVGLRDRGGYRGSRLGHRRV